MRFHCDNIAVVSMVNKGYLPEQPLIQLLRCLSFFAAYFGFTCSAEYFPGTINATVDALSQSDIILSIHRQVSGQWFQIPYVTCWSTILPVGARQLGSLGVWQRHHTSNLTSLLIWVEAIFILLLHLFSTQASPPGGYTLPLCSIPCSTGTQSPSYLSACRYVQVASGLPDPSLSFFPHLIYVLKGVQRSPRPCTQHRLPDMLKAVAAVWRRSPVHFDFVMLWATCCLGFFGLLRAGEFTCPSMARFDQSAMLAWGNVSVDSHTNPSYIVVHLKRSKGDPIGAGVSIYLGRTYQLLCPVFYSISQSAPHCQAHSSFLPMDHLYQERGWCYPYQMHFRRPGLILLVLLAITLG